MVTMDCHINRPIFDLRYSEMIMPHLEDLIFEYYEWQGYFIKRNVKVGKLLHGGWEMELDLIAYNPSSKHLIHLEPSLDANPWEIRNKRFTKKFMAAQKYLFSEVFTWLEPNTPLEQVAILPSHPKGKDELAGGKIYSVDELMAEIRRNVCAKGIMAKHAIPEIYPLLRTIQLANAGYYKAL